MTPPAKPFDEHDPLHDPVSRDAVSRDPVRRDPVLRDPVRRDPVRRDPVRRDPVLHEPNAHDPLAYDSRPFGDQLDADADWLDPRRHADLRVSPDFVDRTLTRVLEQQTDPDLHEILAAYVVPEASPSFVADGMRRLAGDVAIAHDATAPHEATARHAAAAAHAAAPSAGDAAPLPLPTVGTLAGALAHYAVPEPSSDFVARTLHALRARAPRPRPRRAVPWAIAAVAAAALALVALGLWVAQSGGPNPAHATPPTQSVLADAREELSPTPWSTAWAAGLAAERHDALPPPGGALLLAHLVAEQRR